MMLGAQVAVRAWSGRTGLRYTDAWGFTLGGILTQWEMKSGGAVRTPSQLAKDVIFANRGGTIVGKNAPEAFVGKTVKMQTIERRDQ